MSLVSQQLLDLEFLTPDPGGFAPVYFSQMDRAIGQSNTSGSLAFAPATTPIDSSQPGNLADSRPCSERLDVRNLAQNLESHQQIVSRCEIGHAISSVIAPARTRLRLDGGAFDMMHERLGLSIFTSLWLWSLGDVAHSEAMQCETPEIDIKTMSGELLPSVVRFAREIPTAIHAVCEWWGPPIKGPFTSW
jgi:hypothetical protein